MKSNLYDDLWILEWSKKQNAFHVQRAMNAIESNLQALVNNDARDYIVLMIGSRQDCDKVADRWRHRLAVETIRPIRVPATAHFC